MKKLTIGIGAIMCVVLMAASYKTSIKSLHMAVDSSGLVNESLNGILQADADQMVKNALTKADPTPANTQIWFSRQVVENVYDLLREDSTTSFKPDGIRIYFSSTDTAVAAKHDNYGIVVVSTYFGGLDTVNSQTKIIVHKDYFQHASGAALFKTGGIGGVITHDNDATNGDSLNMVYNSALKDTCVASSDHYITRQEGAEMVLAFQGNSLKARSEWFDINMLGNLVKEMKDKNEDGIRVYFARGVDGINSADDVGKARFAIVTTVPGPNSNIHLDYFGCTKCAAMMMKAALRKKLDQGGNDNGELCPSNCDGVTLP
ncbi:MAG TPA: hypothetical protein VNX40_14515 [Mucilaginibacter sp.]|jgi:hypothetical protein|nr:hypothetical protein [Mucilaginibacter sp.]